MYETASRTWVACFNILISEDIDDATRLWFPALSWLFVFGWLFVYTIKRTLHVSSKIWIYVLVAIVAISWYCSCHENVKFISSLHLCILSHTSHHIIFCFAFFFLLWKKGGAKSSQPIPLYSFWVCRWLTSVQCCYSNEYMKDLIFELRRKVWLYDWSSQLHTQLKQALISQLLKLCV